MQKAYSFFYTCGKFSQREHDMYKNLTDMRKQITNSILMVRPAKFGYNAETAGNNAFQDANHGLSSKKAQQLAIKEFDDLVVKLRSVDIKVTVVEDTLDLVKYDAIFPNNWITTHTDGTIVTYPMFSEMRRLERRDDIVEILKASFHIDKHVKLEKREELERYLEGTGSMILDRPNRIAYACRSIRTDESLLEEFCLWLGYEKVLFEAYDEQGLPIYHTNVMMALGESLVVICLDTITDAVQRRLVTEKLLKSGKDIIDIRRDQMRAFAGNMIQLRGASAKYLVMSSQAYNILEDYQIDQIKRHSEILHSPIPTIEQLGGGSVRCMIAELFLQVR